MTIFKRILLSTWCINLLASNVYIISNKSNYCLTDDTKASHPKQIYYNQKKKNLQNFFNFFTKCVYYRQNAYFHATKPQPWIEASYYYIIPFYFDVPFIFISSDKQNYDPKINYYSVPAKDIVKNIKQAGKYETSGNSGSYYYNDSRKDENRIVDWNNVATSFSNLYVDHNNDGDWHWMDEYNGIGLESRLIWPKDTYIKGLNCIKVFQKGNNPAYEYQSNEPFSFLKGINKDMFNALTDIYAYPYIYVLEAYYIYVVYNYGARYFYCLQSLLYPNTGYYQNDLAYDLNDLIKIDHVDYLNNNVVFKLNNDFITTIKRNDGIYDEKYINKFINKYQRAWPDQDMKAWYLSFVSHNEINMDNVDYLLNSNMDFKELYRYIKANPNELNQKLNQYKIKQLGWLPAAIDLLIDKLSFYFDLTLFNPITQSYENKQYDLSLKDLINGYSLNIKPNANNEYKFKLNNIHIHPYQDDHIYNLECNNYFDISYSSHQVIMDNDKWIKIIDPVIMGLKFNDLNQSLNNKYPSEISINDLINHYVFFVDENNECIKISDRYFNNFKLTPNDINGTLAINVNIDGHSYNHTYTNLSKFNLDKYSNIDISKQYNNFLASQIDLQEIMEILKNNGFDPYLLNHSIFKIKNTNDEKGLVVVNMINNSECNYKYEDDINIYGFNKVSVTPINNSKILNNYQINQVNEQMVKDYLLDFSNGFKNKYGDNFNVILTKEKNKLNVRIVTNDFEKSFNYLFKNTKSIAKYFFLGLLTISIIGLISTIVISYMKNKNTKQESQTLDY